MYSLFRGTFNLAFIIETKLILCLGLIFLAPIYEISLRRFNKYLGIYMLLLFVSILFARISGESRFSMGLVGEINYDLFIIAIAIQKIGEKREIKTLVLFYIFLSALSLSRMNMLLSLLLFLKVYKSLPLKLLFAAIAGAVFYQRGFSLSLNSIDRLVFISEWFYWFSSELSLFPIPLGCHLYNVPYVELFSWYIDDMARRNNLPVQVYPFMYHFFIGRVIAQYGLLLVVFFAYLSRSRTKISLSFYVIAMLSFSWLYILPISIFYTRYDLKNNF